MTTNKYGIMVSHMKTTIDVGDDLFLLAKKRAAEERRSLRSLVEEGLRAVLAPRRAGKKATPRKIRWVTVRGGLPAGLDVADREAMHAWIAGERSKS